MCPPAGNEGVGRFGAVRVWLLGGFRVSVGRRTIEQDQWRLRKATALVKLLALSSGHRLHREQAMDALWPDSSRKSVSNNLRQTLLAARRALDPSLGSQYLVSEDKQLLLCPEGELWVDVDAFEEAAATARRARDPAAYRAALELYSGELLPGDRYEEWAEGRRQELHHTWLSLHLELARVYEERGEYEKGIELLQRALLEEPTNEAMHAALMRLYTFCERQGEALAQYGRLVEALSGQLDAQVGPTTERLREEIAAGTLVPAHPTVAPTEEPSDVGMHNLPASRTSFVGREHEMMEIKRHLAMTRLLTLTGAGGSGKTRLALEVARELVGAYPDGVWLAELASLSEGEFVAQSVAEAVGVPGQPSRPLTDTLVDALRTKKMVLIFDNCEHLIDDVASLVALLLDSCPRLRILATSREALGAVGEVIWPVSLLSVPDLRRAPTVEQLEGYEAVRLFVDRARQRAPTFALRSENAQAVAQICVQLEGWPLAIELAAARIKMLPPKALLGRLEDRLKLLTGGPRESSERQRTLRSTIEWSYDLLEEDEKALFGRLSVFSGGATLEAIEAVCDALGDLSVDAFEGSSSLLEKSLLGQEEGAEGEPRLVMLETIREYARKRLGESGKQGVIGQAHAQYYLRLIEQVEPELKASPRQAEWLARLEPEHDNMRAALAWSLQEGETQTALHLVGALRYFWFMRGYLSEGRRWLQAALAASAGRSDAAVAKALVGIGAIAQSQGDYQQAEAFLKKGVALHRKFGDTRDLAGALNNLGNVALHQGRYEEATPLYEESLALWREEGEKYGVEGPLGNLGNLALYRGDYERARLLYEESLELAREVGDKQGVALALGNLGAVAIHQQDYRRAMNLQAEGLALAQELGDMEGVAYGLEMMATAADAQGQVRRAARLWGTAEVLRESIGAPLPANERPDYNRQVTAARSQLEEAAWLEAWAKGQAMTLEEAISYALEKEDTDPLTTSAPGEPSTGQALVVLSRREEEVAALVAQGMSNNQIAQELYLSEHTVKRHISKILRKLGLASRAEVAAWATERQLTPPFE
jgi:predicted ATPase/DNA-binding SARP family transcriptional activator/DNA-binding CsgD family transcriptional regulator